MKKLIALLLAVVMVMGLAACGSKTTTETKAPTEAKVDTPATEAKTDARWHPATKLLMGAALLVVPYLWWTSEPDSGAVPATGPAGTPSAAAVGAPAPSLAPYVLPPLEHFTAVVERPLFSPTRRMPPLPEPSSEPQSEPAETPADTPKSMPA